MRELTPEMASLSRIRSAATWVRRNAKRIDDYPKLSQMSPTEITDAERFATGIYPWPHKWTLRLYAIAKAG